MRRRHEPHVDSHGPRAAEALELALLQHAKELHLRGRRDVADSVEEERALVGELDPPGFALRGARERALLVAKQLALEERVGERSAVQLDEGALRARAAVVDGSRDELLASAGLAVDEHRGGAPGRARHELAHLPHGRGVADEVAVEGAALGARSAPRFAPSSTFPSTYKSSARSKGFSR